MPNELRNTEIRILNEIKNGELTDANSNDLILKMTSKDQTNERGIKIADATERESMLIYDSFDTNTKSKIKQSIQNYTSDSSVINNEARTNPNNPNAIVTILDETLSSFKNKITENNRIVYRLIDYTNLSEIPYGKATSDGTIINVGDYVGDLGFLSTSEHRQFILGKESANPPKAPLMIAIHGRTGVPIAMHLGITSYSNANQKDLYDMEQSKKGIIYQTIDKIFGPGPTPGQAEVLFPRNSVFKVKSIKRNKDSVAVVLDEYVGARPAIIKNMKYGKNI